MIELERNIEDIESDINIFVETMIETISKRKDDLIKQLQQIKKQKSALLVAAELITGRDSFEEVSDIDTYVSNTLQTLQSNSDITAEEKHDIAVGCCLRFVVDKAVLDILENFGTIDEGRSLAAKSRVRGTGLKYSFVNEPSDFQLTTCDSGGKQSWVPQDHIDVHIESHTGFTADVHVINRYDGIYDVSYRAPMPGKYSITVTVNGQQLPQCPYSANVFPTHDLQFSVPNNFHENDESRHGKQSWVIQHGNRSALLSNQDNKRSSKLYTNFQFNKYSTPCWRVRLTIACPKVIVKLGCMYQSPMGAHLDEEHYCQFQMNDNQSPVPTRRNTFRNQNHSRHQHHQNGYNRKQSTFERSTVTFLVVINSEEDTLNVVRCDTNEEKVAILGQSTTAFQPYFGMKHFCKNDTCPRPILSIV